MPHVCVMHACRVPCLPGTHPPLACSAVFTASYLLQPLQGRESIAAKLTANLITEAGADR